jgi:hypothetical protein
MTDAVVFATDNAEDKDGPWVETWDFAITQENSESFDCRFVARGEQPRRSRRNASEQVLCGSGWRISSDVSLST